MSAIQELILQTILKIAYKFDQAKTAGDDCLIFFKGNNRISIRYYISLDVFQIMSRQPYSNKVGVRETELLNYLAELT
jgi:hypothetical protein